ncbi:MULTISPECIES: hypothetical protein [Marivita]|uniref:Uncharacterized protein n=1 Tax=Marivita cryptomonadis TaxID=505252 RepID=A0A9Q2PC94_9RHOB|nr:MULTISPECIES: hypothetical protein [Marivita]MCR9170682.1 hypothetical protein [Paracoccaceae bacterium]MBM2322214.1 hypothetical protein [Marivita cryptomonadis]MBM2331795.1 hypothetical protein [Marivita cryptomonadis]MBM2341380.1 hypothetical protein [Marivita cryptomonadis]MBM2346043.1 hypothetical protein [Marivita cryptomonadis]
MVHYDENYVRSQSSVGTLVRRILGIACLIAVPGIWLAVQGALPEARIMGLGLSVIVMGFAGLCLFGR